MMQVFEKFFFWYTVEEEAIGSASVCKIVAVKFISRDFRLTSKTHTQADRHRVSICIDIRWWKGLI